MDNDTAEAFNALMHAHENEVARLKNEVARLKAKIDSLEKYNASLRTSHYQSDKYVTMFVALMATLVAMVLMVAAIG